MEAGQHDEHYLPSQLLVEQQRQPFHIRGGTFNADPYLVVANPNDYLGMGDDAVANEELDKIRVNSSSSSSLGESKSLSGQATLQVNRKLNNKGRNITFRGSYSLGDSESDQYSSQLTRYYEEAGWTPSAGTYPRRETTTAIRHS